MKEDSVSEKIDEVLVQVMHRTATFFWDLESIWMNTASRFAIAPILLPP